MLDLIAAAAAVAAAPPTNAPAIIGGLAGCWTAPGHVGSKDATSVARGEWHLGKRYFMLHLKSVSPKLPYEAALLYGAGEQPDSISAWWMDTFGGAFSTSGKGKAAADGFSVDYAYPEALYTNRFRRSGKGWIWTIMEIPTDKPARLFAEYRLSPARCSAMKFDF